MKFNDHEISLYASARLGKADKEGCLWMREVEGKIRKKQNYVQRWFLLSGNLLFYCKSETPDSSIVGVIILERCKMDPDIETGNRYAFKLVFEDSDIVYFFMANFAKDQDEWMRALRMAGYEYLRAAFSDLRGQLIHLTGKDPLQEDHPLGALPIKNMSTVPASGPAHDGEPAFELSLACSSLVGDGVPSALIVTSCMTPPQDYWMRYAQTEVIEKNCDPRFFTTVVFYMGSVSMATNLKFEVFDMFNRKEQKMNPIGQAQCKVMELLMSLQQVLRLEIKYNGAVCGFLTVKAWRAKEAEHSTIANLSSTTKSVVSGSAAVSSIPGLPVRGEEVADGGEGAHSPFNFRAPMDNIVIRTFQFPASGPGDKHLKVTEVMGECRLSFTIPMQLLEMFIAEENDLLSQFNSITGLCQDWEISRQDVMLEHRQLVQYYSEKRSGLQAQVEAGMMFKKSTKKGAEDLDFVPVNLHIQQMKVDSEHTENKDKVVYTTVTVGCPTAYRFKYKGGGLAKMTLLPSIMPSIGSFSTTAENKAFRIKALIARIDNYADSLHSDCEQLKSAVLALEEDKNRSKSSKSAVNSCMHTIMERTQQLTAHCGVILVNDSLREWHAAQADRADKLPTEIEINASSLFHKLEQQLLSIKEQVDDMTSTLLSFDEEQYFSQVKDPIFNFLTCLGEVVGSLRRALLFILVKESYRLVTEKVPIGIKSYKHRRDIVFSHTVTTIVTSFVFKLLQSMGNQTFPEQLLEVGFLVHWESLLSTIGDEAGMLEDFIVAIHDANNLLFKMVLAKSVNDTPKVKGSRYKVVVEVPVQKALFRVLPPDLQQGTEIVVFVVLFTQGINEQQSIADKFGDNSVQDTINTHSVQQLTTYCAKFKESFGASNVRMSLRVTKMMQLLEQLRTQVHSRKYKNVDILSLSQELCRLIDCGRVTSCKSAKDRTAMSVTLEEAHILLQEMQMESSSFHQALDVMRSQGTRLRNAEKNVGTPLYAFNAFQVFTLPLLYRPPDGTYKKLQT